MRVLETPHELCSENTHEVVESVRSALEARPEKIVLDLRDVRLVDSSGVRSLLQSQRLCAKAGTAFELGGVSECADRIIRMAGFERVLGLDSRDVLVRSAEPVERGEPLAQRVIEHVVVSDPSMLHVLRHKVTEAAEEAGATGEELCDIRIAVGEALTNAYKHGSPNKGVDKIALRCVICQNALAVEVQDEGQPFDPDGVSEPEPNQMRESGMGIHLMRLAMDVVEFTFNCPGNRVRMIKWLGN